MQVDFTPIFVRNNSAAFGLLAVNDQHLRFEAPRKVDDHLVQPPLDERHMQLRAQLMTALSDHLKRSRISQTQAAKLLGVRQPRISDLMRGKVHLFTLQTLVKMATTAGLHLEMQISNRADPLNVHLFSVEAMVKMAAVARLHVDMKITAPPSQSM